MAFFNWSELVSGSSNSCEVVVFLKVYHLEDAEPFIDGCCKNCVTQIKLDDIYYEQSILITCLLIITSRGHRKLDNTSCREGNDDVVWDQC